MNLEKSLIWPSSFLLRVLMGNLNVRSSFDHFFSKNRATGKFSQSDAAPHTDFSKPSVMKSTRKCQRPKRKPFSKRSRSVEKILKKWWDVVDKFSAIERTWNGISLQRILLNWRKLIRMHSQPTSQDEPSDFYGGGRSGLTFFFFFKSESRRSPRTFWTQLLFFSRKMIRSLILLERSIVE